MDKGRRQIYVTESEEKLFLRLMKKVALINQEGGFGKVEIFFEDYMLKAMRHTPHDKIDEEISFKESCIYAKK